MTTRTKIGIGIGLVVLFGGLIAFFLLRQPAGEPVPTSQPRWGFLPEALQRFITGRGGVTPGSSGGPSTTPPPTAETRRKERLYRISTEPAFNPGLSADGSTIRYFSRASGHLWESDTEGLNQRKITEEAVGGIADVQWSSNGEYAVLTIGEPGEVQRVATYRFSTRSAVGLDRSIRSATFNPAGTRLLYHYLNTANGEDYLAIANPDGTGFKALLRPQFDDFALTWPREEYAALHTRPSFAAQTRLYAIDTRTGLLNKVLMEDAWGLAAAWSPNGLRYLASRATEDGRSLSLIVGTYPQSQVRETFGLFTLADKCVWRASETSFVCAVPTDIPQDAVLPDAYYKGVFSSADDVVEVDVGSLERRTIARSSELFPSLDIDKPLLSRDEKKLFFVNRRDGFVYALRLTAE